MVWLKDVYSERVSVSDFFLFLFFTFSQPTGQDSEDKCTGWTKNESEEQGRGIEEE